MADWNDVRKFMETGEEISPIPEGCVLYPVVGLSFMEDYPKNILALKDLGEVNVKLIRNPNNEYDANAIQVHSTNGMLGHLPKEVAAQLAPKMDAGTVYIASVYQVRISPDNPKQPGLDILLKEWV